MPNKAKILIVDDEPEIVKVLKEFLSIKGYSVTGAYSGEEALSILEKEKPDCVLLDIMMPGMKGTEAAKIIKKKYPSIKIIILTGFVNLGDSLVKERLTEAIFRKPFSLQELADKLSDIIELKQYVAPASAGLKEKGKIQARILIIKAKLFLLEPSGEIYAYLERHFKKLSQQGKEYELNQAANEQEIIEKFGSFNPDLIMVNTSLFKKFGSDELRNLLEQNLGTKEIIVYNIPDVKSLPSPELEKLTKSIEIFCLKNGLVEIKWVEI